MQSQSATVYHCLRCSSSLLALISSVHMDNISNIPRLRFRNVLVLKASFSKNFQQIFDTNFPPTISQTSQFGDAHLPLSISLVDFEMQTSLPMEAPSKKCASKQGPLKKLPPPGLFWNFTLLYTNVEQNLKTMRKKILKSTVVYEFTLWTHIVRIWKKKHDGKRNNVTSVNWDFFPRYFGPCR